MLAVLNTTNIRDAAQKSTHYSPWCTDRDTDVADQIKQAREDLTTERDAQRRRSASPVEPASDHSGAAEARDAQSQQMQFEDKVQARLDAALSESAVLESQDERLAAESHVTKPHSLHSSAPGVAGRARAPADRQHQRGQCGWDLREHADRRKRACPPRGGAGRRSAARRMGYRDTNAQITLRQAHCGSSPYAVYAMPSYQCSPPTAPPGT